MPPHEFGAGSAAPFAYYFLGGPQYAVIWCALQDDAAACFRRDILDFKDPTKRGRTSSPMSIFTSLSFPASSRSTSATVKAAASRTNGGGPPTTPLCKRASRRSSSVMYWPELLRAPETELVISPCIFAAFCTMIYHLWTYSHTQHRPSHKKQRFGVRLTLFFSSVKARAHMVRSAFACNFICRPNPMTWRNAHMNQSRWL